MDAAVTQAAYYLPSLAVGIIGLGVAAALWGQAGRAAFVLAAAVGLGLFASVLSYGGNVWLMTAAERGEELSTASTVNGVIAMFASLLHGASTIGLYAAVWLAVRTRPGAGGDDPYGFER